MWKWLQKVPVWGEFEQTMKTSDSETMHDRTRYRSVVSAAGNTQFILCIRMIDNGV